VRGSTTCSLIKRNPVCWLLAGWLFSLERLLDI
jgi:hypothetical protein